MTNDPTGWTTLPLKVAQVTRSCPTSQDFAGATVTQNLVADNQDGEVVSNSTPVAPAFTALVDRSS